MSDRVTADFAGPVRVTERMAVAWHQAPFARRAWFAVTLAAILAVHATVLAVFLRHDDPAAAPAAEETAVEVVAEMPKPPEAAPKPAAKNDPAMPKPMVPQPPEKPATSAPRAQNDETVDRDAGASETRAPKAAAAPPSSLPAPSRDVPQPLPQRDAKLEPKPDPSKSENSRPDEAKPAEKPADAAPDQSEKDEQAAAPSDDHSDAEALAQAAPEPPRRPAAPPKPVPPKPPARPARMAAAVPQPLPQALPSAIDRLAGDSDLPDFVFAKPQRKPTRYKGGSEDNRYLAVVFAMVTQNQEPVVLPPGEWQVAVSFEVDGHGRLIGIGLSESSGYAEVDAAALDAVRRAAPFPPPPSGGPTGMTARMGSRQIRAAQGRAGRADSR